ncbi:aryl-sulfate sulfotransferase, partial [bacterium]|nr:aryl-sulfate sulfotransferase [bacterium]
MTINNIKTTLLALVFLTSAAAAAPQAWFHPDGTLHYYEAISVPDGISWDEANLLSSNSGGYLATVTSQAENDLIFDLVDDPSYWYQRDGGIQNGPFFGGFQLDGSVEPAGGWRWISGEDFMYTNWGQNQPSNTNNDQNRVFFGGTETNRTSTWSDISKNISLLSGFVVEYSAEEQTMGLFQYDVAASFEGYNLFAPQNSNNVYLIDNWGRLVNEWVTESDQGNSAYLLENGHLLRTVQIDNERFAAGGYTGKIEEYDWDGNLIWEFTHSSDTYMHHHDLAYLPNGNVLILAWELKTEEEAIQAGRDPEKLPEGELWPDYIFEVEPTFPSGGNIVWEWHVWDHMIQDFDATKDNFGVVEDHPELIDVNFHSHGTYVADWQHGNAIDYNAELDQIIYSVWGFDEFWIIDHSTTSEESAAHTGGNRGKGGDLLYRWGNPLAYRAGALEDQKLFNQHNPHWIASSLPGAGNILVFNNGNGRIGGNYSSVEELTLPSDGFGNYIMPLPGEAFGPEEPTWMYVAEPPETFYAAFISGASRQPNGNTLICSGPQGKLFEVTSVGEKVWEYIV